MNYLEKTQEDQAPFVSLVKFRNEMGVSDVTAWRWRKRGILKTVNIGGRQFVPYLEMERFRERAEAGELAVESAAPLAKKNEISKFGGVAL